MRRLLPRTVCACLALGAVAVIVGVVAVWPRPRSQALKELLRVGQSLPPLDDEEALGLWWKQHRDAFWKAAKAKEGPEFLPEVFETFVTGSAQESRTCAFTLVTIDYNLDSRREELRALAREYSPRLEAAMWSNCVKGRLEHLPFQALLEIAHRPDTYTITVKKRR